MARVLQRTIGTQIGDTDSNPFIVDATNDRVGVNANPSDYRVDANDFVVKGTLTHSGISVHTPGTDVDSGNIFFVDDADVGGGTFTGGIKYRHDTDEMWFYTDSTTKFIIGANGNTTAQSTAGVFNFSRDSSSGANNGAIVQIQNSDGNSGYVGYSGDEKLTFSGNGSSIHASLFDSGGGCAFEYRAGTLTDGPWQYFQTPSGYINYRVRVGGNYYRVQGGTTAAEAIGDSFTNVLLVRAGVGIGINTGDAVPAGALHVKGGNIQLGDASAGASGIVLEASTSQNNFITWKEAGTSWWSINSNYGLNVDFDIDRIQNGARKARLPYTGAFSAWSFSSDQRLKENIDYYSGALDLINQLKVREFDWIESGEHDIGFIAQEVQSVIPAIVSGDPNSDLEVDHMMVADGALVPYLTRAIQELKEEKDAEIQALRDEIELLKGGQ